MKMYNAKAYLNEVTAVEVERATESSVWVVSAQGVWRHNRESSCQRFCKTKGEAVGFIAEYHRKKIEYAVLQVEHCRTKAALTRVCED